MKIELNNVWVVMDKLPNREPKYFAGMETDEGGWAAARFEPLSADTKVYKNKRGATAAARIANSNYESPFITVEFVEHAEYEEVDCEPEVTALPKSETMPLDPVPADKLGGWLTIEKLCGKYPYMLRKKAGTVFRYAIAYSETDVRYLPADEVYAWSRYCDECKDFITDKIRKRRIAEGKDPDGSDDWKR